jgi:hypothetical protein
VSDKAIPLPVKAVRRLHPNGLKWRYDVTFGSPSSGHDDPTLTVTSEQLDTEPKPGDVILVVPPRVVGFYENQPELT